MSEPDGNNWGWTPQPDVIVRDCGRAAASVWGVVYRFCQMADGCCWASQSLIARRAGVCRETVVKHLKALVESGYLRDATPERKGRTHVYAVTDKATVAKGTCGGDSQAVDNSEGGGAATCGGDSQGLLKGSTGSCGDGSQPPVEDSDTKKESPKRESQESREQESTHGAATPGVPADVGTLADYFAARTKIRAPDPVSDRNIRERRVLWIEPLREIARLAGSAAEGQALMDEALRRLSERNCIIKAPSSILGTVRSVAAEQARGRDPSRYLSGRYSDRVKH